jgi:hypothetical protein
MTELGSSIWVSVYLVRSHMLLGGEQEEALPQGIYDYLEITSEWTVFKISW